jgi:hypothetical protein
VKEQIYLVEANLEDVSVVRESRLNVFEPVFSLVVPDHVEDYQCLPGGFQLYWDLPWGGFVTLRLVSTFKQYNFFTGMLQELTDLLVKSGQMVPRRIPTAAGLPRVPFEIVVVEVPKNFVRKLVGYQEKNLAQYRKEYQVDFDYSRDLINDEVFSLSETTQLRVFGLASDVREVNTLVQRELEHL